MANTKFPWIFPKPLNLKPLNPFNPLNPMKPLTPKPYLGFAWEHSLVQGSELVPGFGAPARQMPTEADSKAASRCTEGLGFGV